MADIWATQIENLLDCFGLSEQGENRELFTKEGEKNKSDFERVLEGILRKLNIILFIFNFKLPRDVKEKELFVYLYHSPFSFLFFRF